MMRLGRWNPPHVPWLPAMPGVVLSSELQEKAPDLGSSSTILGLADLPARQSQRVVALDLERHQNLLVFGTSRSGKTTVLRSLAIGFIGRVNPDEILIYGLDFTGHGLHFLEDAPQVGGVVEPDEVGRVARLLRRLSDLVNQRKRLMSNLGVSGFADLVVAHRNPCHECWSCSTDTPTRWPCSNEQTQDAFSTSWSG